MIKKDTKKNKSTKNPLLEKNLMDDGNEANFDRTLRPKLLDDYIGQEKTVEQLKIFIQATKQRKEPLDHVLFFGPPGIGKTTLANILAYEMEVNIKQTSGPVIEKAGDLASLLTNLESNDILFIDEIHRLSPAIEEILYPALEDFRLDLMIGEGPGARSVKVDLAPFTLVAATTRAGMLTNPLRDRFGISSRLDFYSVENISKIINRASKILGVIIDKEGSEEIARRSRGTPRIANRLLRRIRDYADIKYDSKINKEVAKYALDNLDIDDHGLDLIDRKFLTIIMENFDGGPVGIDNLCASLGESKDTIEDVIEPYLIQEGFLQRTPRGRMITRNTMEYLKIKEKKSLWNS